MNRFLNKAVLVMALLLVGTGMAHARDQIKITGSSTVFPFSSYVAEEMGATTKFPAPVVESTGSGGGQKLFGTGIGANTPDIANSSRRMKDTEFEAAEKNGVTDITEAMIGFDGIAIAQNKDNAHFDITLQELAMAVAADVPVDGKIVPNPYKMWNEINPNLPARKIVFYGPPTSSGTRDAFEEMVVEKVCGKIEGYEKGYKKIRQDNAYVPAGENDNLIVQKLTNDKDAFGIFGFSFLSENSDSLQGTAISGVDPTPEAIAEGTYPISRSLFFYIKNAHYDAIPGLKEYVELFMSEKMIGTDGLLKSIGLVPMPDAMRAEARQNVLDKKKLTLESLKKK
ncbi:MAG: PstS family phosphate ABC transporter substrate-binding protein [Desulfomicrobium sp.]|nr:PstS family phosphate ABC transporter substrate-binding protein [Pseudomonadota bacterium]MBV1712376.1 PstS family phosphate ABC transporter substrate-binding protein [Desulfomicrobium sp.]MBU4572536.1 PstS family phosphate ABC transporter substrate-binding protein [Pseudomonadota bacterium]MBU4595130.1 PstS family phosphate ABC transporter substrate-binding protein [Pseudomonadota bacterium]MBV1719609.1 PstS family phosphate ABC transporter substrate-binding protein [Desulfomicrobium sp.]